MSDFKTWLEGKSQVEESPHLELHQFENQGKEISIVYPVNQVELQRACSLLRSGQAVILDYSKLSLNQAQRVVDYVNGAVFALEGQASKLSQTILVLLPAGSNFLKA